MALSEVFKDILKMTVLGFGSLYAAGTLIQEPHVWGVPPLVALPTAIGILTVCVIGELYIIGLPWIGIRKQILRELQGTDLNKRHRALAIIDTSCFHLSILHLNELGQAVEQAAARDLQALSGPDPSMLQDRFCFQSLYTRVAKNIANRKSKLAKEKDGVMLAGETVRCSRGRAGMYAAVRLRVGGST